MPFSPKSRSLVTHCDLQTRVLLFCRCQLHSAGWRTEKERAALRWKPPERFVLTSVDGTLYVADVKKKNQSVKLFLYIEFGNYKCTLSITSMKRTVLIVADRIILTLTPCAPPGHLKKEMLEKSQDGLGGGRRLGGGRLQQRRWRTPGEGLLHQLRVSPVRRQEKVLGVAGAGRPRGQRERPQDDGAGGGRLQDERRRRQSGAGGDGVRGERLHLVPRRRQQSDPPCGAVLRKHGRCSGEGFFLVRLWPIICIIKKKKNNSL